MIKPTYVKKIFLSITTTDDNFFMKTININDVNYKLNTHEDMLLFPFFDITSSNVDGFYNSLSLMVMHADRPYTSHSDIKFLVGLKKAFIYNVPNESSHQQVEL